MSSTIFLLDSFMKKYAKFLSLPGSYAGRVQLTVFKSKYFPFCWEVPSQGQYLISFCFLRQGSFKDEFVVGWDSLLLGISLSFIPIYYIFIMSNKQLLLFFWMVIQITTLKDISPKICYNNTIMLYLIRHAESEFNAVADKLEHKYGPDFLDEEEYIKEKFDEKFLDVDITEEGRKHTLEAREKMKGIEVDLIIVSPMRRALHTCSIIFQGHPSKAPVVVEPAFREIMESSNDIGSKLVQSMQLFPSFDFSALSDKEAWYVHTLHDEKDKEMALAQLQGLEGQDRSRKAIDICLALEKESWKERRSNVAYEQALKMRVLPNYNEQLRVLQHYSQKYKRIAVVAHSECIKRYAGYKIKNCEIFPMKTDILQLSIK